MFSRLYKNIVTALILCQMIGAGAIWLFVSSAPSFGISLSSVPMLAVTGIAGLIAASASALVFKQPWWWWAINSGFPFAFVAGVALSNTYNISPWVYLIVFIALTAVYWNVGSSRIPLYLSNNKTGNALADMVPSDQNTTFIDLGCGLGSMTNIIARKRPDCRVIGIENAPIPYAFSWLRKQIFGPANVDLRYGSFWNVSLAEYNTVYCFLSPAPMARLFAKAKKEMHSGSTFISNSFDVPEETPDKTVSVDDARGTKLLVWLF